MDLIKKFAIAVVMIVPGFVFGGLIWSLFHSWFAVLGMEIIVVLVYFGIITGKFSRTEAAV